MDSGDSHLLNRVSLFVFAIIVILAMAPLSEATVNYQKWELSYQNWSPDCMQTTIISINGGYPGPTIRAREGDTVVVELNNQMPTENVVIHWHGIHQHGTPWSDGTASITQCAIQPGETFNYTFTVGIPGTYFYHGHYGLQRSAGLYGSLIVESAKKEPFAYDGELSIILDDWWHTSTYEQAVGLSSNPFVWVGEPQSLLIQGRGKYNCSADSSTTCNATSSQCLPYILPVKPGKTYRLRIVNVASLSALNFLIQGHNMTVVEADGHYVEPVSIENLDVYSGESYSVLVRADQDASKNYWAAVNVRGRQPMTPTGLAILNYLPNPSTNLPSNPPPPSPAWNDYTYSKTLAKKFLALRGHEVPPPLKPTRQLILLSTQNTINGFIKWAINNVSLELPPTPYLAAMKYKIKGAYDKTPPQDIYHPQDYNIMAPPTNPNATEGNGVYVFELNSVVDVILQNANTLTANDSEIHPWHLHGHDFWILGYGDGKFDPREDPKKYNVVNPPLRNTVALFPYGWTALRFKANNPGVWAFHCHLEAHFFMGMVAIFAEGVEKVGRLPLSSMGCGLAIDKMMHP